MAVTAPTHRPLLDQARLGDFRVGEILYEAEEPIVFTVLVSGSQTLLAYLMDHAACRWLVLGKTIRKHLEGILAYIRTGISNGRSEGFNGKARVITKRAFGFHSATAFIATLYLCCSGLELNPRHT
jgi:hypothetical protein